MKFKVLLDMDGVLVNFVGGICKALGKENPFDNRHNLGKWDLAAIWGISEEEFWEACSSHLFWTHLDWMLDGRMILRAAEDAVGAENVYILTTPAPDPESAYGKLRWMERELPEYRPRLLMGACKHLCAVPGQILVDDADHNVKAFQEAGGQAILVPREWNANHLVWGTAAEYVRGQLIDLTD